MTLHQTRPLFLLASLVLAFTVISCASDSRRRLVKASDPVQLSFRPPRDGNRPQTVFVAGTFNEWTMNDPAFKCAWNNQEKEFQISFHLSPGRYEYKFIVDGQWIHDPEARESALDPLGGKLGVFHVLPSTTP